MLKLLNREEVYHKVKENDLIILYLRKLVDVYGNLKSTFFLNI